MDTKSIKWLKFRIFLILIFFFAFFSVVFARGYHLQVIKKDELSKLASKQHKRTITLPPHRGNIYDRKGEILATSVKVHSIYADPRRISNFKHAANRLSRILKIESYKLRQNLKKKKFFVWIKRKVSPDRVEKVKRLKIEGVNFIPDTKRYYTNCEFAGHLLGFSGLDSRGLEGIELYYDEFLRGKPRHFVVEIDGKGEILFSENKEEDLSDGSNLVLTLDKNIQYIAEKWLGKAVLKTGAKGGCVIIMDPQTGEILAMANQPEFNPNTFWSYHSSKYRNRAVTDTFEPGSTFKSFLLSAAIEEKIINEDDLFFCENGIFKYRGRTIHDVKKHSWLTLRKVIKFSSNIGAVKIGEKLGKKKYYQYIKDFGFGERTGVDLPGERKGIIRPVKSWSKVALGTTSFGQGMSVTALQLISAFSAIANGGNLMKPYLVREIVDQKGRTITKISPRVVRRVISQNTAERVTLLLKGVAEKGGTGFLAKVPGYYAAGKTGTAQKVDPVTKKYSKRKFLSSFIGFVPADSPKLSILVIIDEPKGVPYGGVIAAPLFKEIASETLIYLGVPPRVETVKKENKGTLFTRKFPLLSSRSGDSRNERYLLSKGEKKIFPNFTGKSIREVLRFAEFHKIEIEIVGSGKAVEQNPKPGVPLKTDSKFQVRFQPSSV